jgi:hypothetical protein
MGPIWDVVMNVKNQRLLWDLYVGIIMNVKNQRLLWDLICGYCIECKKPTIIVESYIQGLH